MKTALLGVVLVPFLISGCGHNALPPNLGPDAPAQLHELQVPSNLEIISVDFDAVAYKGDGAATRRSFFKVYGRHRTTGVRYLLIYERGTKRTRPVDVVEITSVDDDTIIGN